MKHTAGIIHLPVVSFEVSYVVNDINPREPHITTIRTGEYTTKDRYVRVESIYSVENYIPSPEYFNLEDEDAIEDAIKGLEHMSRVSLVRPTGSLFSLIVYLAPAEVARRWRDALSEEKSLYFPKN